MQTRPSLAGARAQQCQSTRGMTSRIAATSLAQPAPVSVIHSISDSLRSKQRSATEVVQHYLDSLARVEPSVGAFITVNREQAIQEAANLDKRIAEQGAQALGPLAGVPVAIKDNICTRGLRTTAGSRILSSFVPTYDATAVARLRSAGAIIVGKTNMDEFGMGSSTENSGYQLTRNPWDTERVPGGSSGGSAAAVAAAQCAVALGSDTGGSIRQPAHFCGVVGLKPTYGRVSRYGLISYASSLDCIGPMASSVQDAAHIMTAIAGGDQHDATCSSRDVPNYASGLVPQAQLSSQPLAGKKLAVVKQTVGAGVADDVSTAVKAAMKHLESLGATIEQVSLPTFELGLPAYYVLAVSEASSNLARYDGVRYGSRDAEAKELQAMYTATRDLGLGPEVKRRILMGTYALSAGYYDAVYKKAQQVRTLIKQELAQALGKYDALLSPAAPTTAYKLGEKSKDPLSMYKGDLCTTNINLAGLPALTLPVGFTQGSGRSLPVGLQIIGREYNEAGILQLGHMLEQTLQLSRPALAV